MVFTNSRISDFLYFCPPEEDPPPAEKSKGRVGFRRNFSSFLLLIVTNLIFVDFHEIGAFVSNIPFVRHVFRYSDKVVPVFFGKLNI